MPSGVFNYVADTSEKSEKNQILTTMESRRSTLELMLDQMLADQPDCKEELPALPVRPVSRARLPQSRRPLRILGGNRGEESSFHANGVVSASLENHLDGNEKSQNSQDLAEREVAKIQKCYRGHRVRCNYKDIRRGMIALQSFARGENARKEYGYRSMRLKAAILIQKHTRRYIQLRLQHNQHEADMSLESGEHINEPVFEEETAAGNCLEREQDQDVNVGYSFIIDLHKRVLRTEAKVRDKSAENVALKMKLEEMDKKWKQSEERMKALEITWQDQLTYAQKCLAASKKNSGLVITFVRSDSVQEHRNINMENNVIRVPDGRSRDFDNENEHVNLYEDGSECVSNKLHPGEELRKLKAKFKTWKKEYRNKLREAQSIFKKIGNAETGKSQRNHWWGIFSH